jgi:enoyl-[acyl-carrier protein] reductase II
MADARGLAAALVLGAAGVNLGTRFLASQESPIGDDWKRAILDSPSEAWVQLDFFNEIEPNPGTLGYGTRLRAFRTPFTDKWQQRGDEVRSDPGAALDEIAKAEAKGELEKLLVVGGQSAGLVVDLPPAAEIVRAVALEAEEALSKATGTVS